MFLSNLDRRVLATLKDAAVGRQKPGPRIAVLGNCQSFDLAYAIKLLDVSATVHHYPIQTKAKITGNMLVRALRTYDRVFLQDFGEGFVRGGSSDFLCSELSNVTRYPSLLFGAYLLVSLIPPWPMAVFALVGLADAALGLRERKRLRQSTPPPST